MAGQDGDEGGHARRRSERDGDEGEHAEAGNITGVFGNLENSSKNPTLRSRVYLGKDAANTAHLHGGCSRHSGEHPAAT